MKIAWCDQIRRAFLAMLDLEVCNPKIVIYCRTSILNVSEIKATHSCLKSDGLLIIGHLTIALAGFIPDKVKTSH